MAVDTMTARPNHPTKPSSQAAAVRLFVIIIILKLITRHLWSCAGIGSQAGSRGSRNHGPMPEGMAKRCTAHDIALVRRGGAQAFELNKDHTTNKIRKEV